MLSEQEAIETLFALPNEEKTSPQEPNESKTLLNEVIRLKSELEKQVILQHITNVARELKVPETVISEVMKYHVEDYIVQDNKIVLAADGKTSAKDALTELQKKKLHWNPTSNGGVSSEPVRATEITDWFTKR
jgi:hypothetical protein